MPSQTFSHNASTTAPIQDAWAALDRPETWEAIGGVDRVFDPKIDEQGRLQGFSFETVAGGKRHTGTASPRQRVEETTMAWDIESSEVKGTTSVDLAADGQGTNVTVTVYVESIGFLSSMLFPLIAGALGKGLPDAVEGFAAQLSSRG